MKRTANTSSSRGSSAERLVRVQLDRLHPHPANSNRMDDRLLQRLVANIERERDYPPLVVRPHPAQPDHYQLLDGHQRLEALRRLGHREAHCYVWPCDDRTALTLLGTLNRLEGQDDPLMRAALLRELTALASPDELARLLPEDAGAISRSLDLLGVDLDEILAEFERETGGGSSLRAVTFALAPDDEAIVERGVGAAMCGLEGRNRRGRALALIAQHYLEEADS